MDETLAQRLVGLTRDFYVRNADSFSDTRRSPWSGWQRVLDFVGFDAAPDEDIYRIADIGCGNLRFEKMLADRLEEADHAAPGSPELDIICVDGNATFLAEAEALRERTAGSIVYDALRIDVVDDLVSDNARALSSIADRDLVVCFAFMHHIPMASWREELLDHLVDMAQPGGHIALSFWCFSRDDRLLEKANAATDAAEERLGIALERTAGDYLMGWGNERDCWRYCHDFTDDDIKEMIESRVRRCGDIVEVARFSADGRSGSLNEYVVLQKR